MTGAPSTVAPPEWFLARDGEQFGPLSDAELRKLVEFGHLKPTDLLWREGFPEWRSARILLSDTPTTPTAATNPPPSQPAAPFQPAAASASQAGVGTHAVGAAPVGMAAAGVSPASVAPQATALQQQQHQAAAVAATTRVAQPSPYAPAAVGRMPDYQGRSQPHADQSHPSHQHGQSQHGAFQHGAPYAGPASVSGGYVPPAAPNHQEPSRVPASRPVDLNRPAPAAPVAAQQRRPNAAPVHRANDDEDDDDSDVNEQSSLARWLKRIGVLLFFTLTLAAAAWYAFPHRAKIGAALNLSRLSSMLPSFAGGSGSPLTGFAQTAEATDAALQANDLWKVLKREFPEWYTERLKEAASLRAGGKSEAEIGQQMMQAIVALRRKHAGDALAGTMPRLKTLAAAFADNLVQLRKVSADACHSFISNGETSPEYLRLLSERGAAAQLQVQLVATFEAIADGRKVPRIYPQPKQADYNLLVAALEARGWTDADMALFSDSRSFGKAPPDKVCKMVTDWFKAQVDLTDADAQLRLLADALKPVVAG